MVIHTKIQKWGNGLALRVAGAMRDVPGFKNGTPVEVKVTNKGLHITRAEPQKRINLPFTEKQLLSKMTPDTAHADILATPLSREINPS